MRAWYVAPLLAFAVTASGCYTTVVETGSAPSREKFRDDWVWGMASGLIMVESVDARRRCSAGVARIETEQSLPNFLVQTVTAGLLSPRSVEVTCARGADHHAPLRHQLEAVRDRRRIEREGRSRERGERWRYDARVRAYRLD